MVRRAGFAEYVGTILLQSGPPRVTGIKTEFAYIFGAQTGFQIQSRTIIHIGPRPLAGADLSLDYGCRCHLNASLRTMHYA